MLLSISTTSLLHHDHHFCLLSLHSLPLLGQQHFIPSVGAAQLTTEELNAKVAANPSPPGLNVVFTNFVNANNDGQFFSIWDRVSSCLLYLLWCLPPSFLLLLTEKCSLIKFYPDLSLFFASNSIF